MLVNKYEIKNTELSGTTGYSINLPMSQNSGLVGQQEIVDTKFVQTEVDKAVNIIFDYEKVKLLPIKCNSSVNDMCVSKTLTSNITYNVNFLNPVTTSSPTLSYNTSLKWADIELTDEDLKLRKNSFTKSFLRLDFYDSDIVTNQNLISFITLFPKFSYLDVSSGSIPLASNYRVSFTLGNPLVNRKENGEGFALYHFKDEIIPTVPKYLYMRATFNNAKNGKSTGLMSSSDTNLTIDQLIKTTKDEHAVNPSVKNNLYTRYILTREVDGYYYEIDTSYSTNVNYNSTPNNYIIDLYQINAL